MEKSILNQTIAIIAIYTFAYYGFSYYIISRHLNYYGLKGQSIIVYEDILFLIPDSLLIITILLVLLIYISLVKHIKNENLCNYICDIFKISQYNFKHIALLFSIIIVLIVKVSIELGFIEYLFIFLLICFAVVLYARKPSEFNFVIFLFLSLIFLFIFTKNTFNKVYDDNDRDKYFCEIYEYIIYHNDTSFVTSNIIHQGYKYTVFELDSGIIRKLPTSNLTIDMKCK